jgi:hypothetical protein
MEKDVKIPIDDPRITPLPGATEVRWGKFDLQTHTLTLCPTE